MGERINIYFTKSEVIVYLRKQYNMSHYIEQLILADMRKVKDVLDEEKVRQIVREFIEKKEE